MFFLVYFFFLNYLFNLSTLAFCSITFSKKIEILIFLCLSLRWSLYGDGIQSTGCLDWSVSNTRSEIPPHLSVDHVECWMISKYSQKGAKQSLCWGDFWSKLKSPRTITLSKSCLGSLSTWCCNWYKNGCLGPYGGRYINTNKTRSFPISCQLEISPSPQTQHQNHLE